MKDFLNRILGEKSQYFTVEIKEASEKGYYRFKTVNNKILIEANNKINVAAGLYRYLKDYLHINYSWCGNRELIIGDIVFPDKVISEEIPQKLVSVFNYCTYGYSMTFWNFERWEKELDFMALNGVNLPLFVVGLEAVWYRVLIKNGLTKDEALSFISSPSHFPWQLMTNIEGVMPIMSEMLINQRLELGQKIIKRMLELGMTPIQMGFSGFVPRIFKEKYFKDAKIKQKDNWCGIEGTCELDPLSPLFKKIGLDFLNAQKELFGAYHFYGCDPFHESTPPVKGKLYLKRVSKSIQKMYEEFDADYVWVMQSWSIKKAIAAKVPKNHLLILDLAGDKHTATRNFWGYNYITGNLHNFGGRINLHGDISHVSKNQFTNKVKKKNIVGTGLFMEGIDQNPLYYDLAFKMLTCNNAVDLDGFLDDYCLRRYGDNNQHLLDGLKLLAETVYMKGTNDVENSSMICARPALDVKKSGPNSGFSIPYDNKKLKQCIGKYLDGYNHGLKDGYFFDIYDITRQLISNELQEIIKRIADAYENKNLNKFNQNKQNFLEYLTLADKLLLTRPEFNLYSQLNSASEYTDDKEVNSKLVKAHKTLLTTWADLETPDIFDYAWREWGGMIGEFYLKRWEKFFEFLNDEFSKTDRYDIKKEKSLETCYGRESFFANDFYKKLGEFEKAWANEDYITKECSFSNEETLKTVKDALLKLNII